MPGLVNAYRFGVPLTPSGPFLYHRVEVIGAEVGGPSINEMELALTPGGADICTGGTASASSTNGTYVAAYAFDDDITSSWRALDDQVPGGSSITYAHTAPQWPTQWRMKSHSLEVLRVPTVAVLKGSNDGATWVPLAFYVHTWSASETLAVPIGTTALVDDPDNPIAWRAVCDVLNGGQSWYVTELVFAGTPGGATLCTGGKALWSHHGPSAMGYYAFDGNSATAWNGKASQGVGSWLGYAKTTPWVPVEMRVTPTISGSDTTAGTIRVQKTSDFQTWHDHKTFSGLTSGWVAGTARAFDLT